MPLVQPWTDITQRFSFENEHLTYNDGPLAGFLRSVESGDRFAFRCCELVRALLWHWILIPVSATDGDPAGAFTSARERTPERWLSIVEDQRLDPAVMQAVWLDGASHPVPATW